MAIAFVAPSLAWGSRAIAAKRLRRHEIVIQGLQYLPETLSVSRGDMVVWINKDPFPHTVTASGAFDSKAIDAGRSWRFTARRDGTFAYVCLFHSNMKGTLLVA